MGQFGLEFRWKRVLDVGIDIKLGHDPIAREKRRELPGNSVTVLVFLPGDDIGAQALWVTCFQ